MQPPDPMIGKRVNVLVEYNHAAWSSYSYRTGIYAGVGERGHYITFDDGTEEQVAWDNVKFCE